MRDSVVQLETVRTLKHLRDQQRALAEQLLTPDAVAGLVTATVHAHTEALRGPPGDPGKAGKAGRSASAAQVAKATEAWLREHQLELRGADGRSPTDAELIALIEGVIASQPERFRGAHGPQGRGIAAARLRADDMLEITWTDGAIEAFGPLVTERESKTTERQVIVTGGGVGGLPESRPSYTQALTGTEVVIPAATHGLAAVHHVQLTDPDGDIAYASVRVSTDHRVRITALIDLTGYTVTLE
ncbi:MAG: hypothetical protein ABF296_12985 [Oceanococcaceae bacterium]